MQQNNTLTIPRNWAGDQSADIQELSLNKKKSNDYKYARIYYKAVTAWKYQVKDETDVNDPICQDGNISRYLVTKTDQIIN